MWWPISVTTKTRIETHLSSLTISPFPSHRHTLNPSLSHLPSPLVSPSFSRSLHLSPLHPLPPIPASHSHTLCYRTSPSYPPPLGLTFTPLPSHLSLYIPTNLRCFSNNCVMIKRWSMSLTCIRSTFAFLHIVSHVQNSLWDKQARAAHASWILYEKDLKEITLISTMICYRSILTNVLMNSGKCMAA